MCNWHGWSVWGGGDNRGPALHHWQITASIALYAPRPHPQLLRIGFVPWKFQNTENLEYSNTLLAHWARRLLVLCGHSFKLMTLGMYWAATTITHDFHTRESSIKIIQYRRRMPRQSFHVGRCCHGAVVAMNRQAESASLSKHHLDTECFFSANNHVTTCFYWRPHGDSNPGYRRERASILSMKK